MKRNRRSRHRLLMALSATALWLAAQTQPVSGSGQDQTIQKPAWRWTTEERLAARFNEDTEKARVAHREARHREAFPGSPTPTAQQPVGHSVRGSETPELFLPFELFDVLINRSFPPDGLHQNEWRRRYEERAAALGLGSNLWARVEKAAAVLLERRREHYRRATASPTPKTEPVRELDISACQDRAEAMAAVRDELGEEAFLQLLYEVVAPSTHAVYAYKSNFSDHLLFQEGGCLTPLTFSSLIQSWAGTTP